MDPEIKECFDRWRTHSGGPLSEQEKTFLRDVQAWIELSIQNGLGIVTIAGVILHDINGIVRHGFDLAAATKDGFSPKVSGWSKVLNSDLVGEPEEVASA